MQTARALAACQATLERDAQQSGQREKELSQRPVLQRFSGKGFPLSEP
jgi:hypothetical protein